MANEMVDQNFKQKGTTHSFEESPLYLTTAIDGGWKSRGNFNMVEPRVPVDSDTHIIICGRSVSVKVSADSMYNVMPLNHILHPKHVARIRWEHVRNAELPIQNL